MDHIVLTCNSINIKLLAAQFMNRCKLLLLPFVNPHMDNPPQSLPHRDVTDWFKVSSEHILFIKTGIYRL